MTARIKRALDVPIIWGGAGPTLEPDWCLEHADMVCIGEGEELIVELANRLDAGADYADIPGLWLQARRHDDPEPGRAASRARARSPSPTSSRRAPSTSTTTGSAATSTRPTSAAQYTIMTQRGCPFSCSFCIESVYQDMFGKKNSLRRRSVDVVIEELVRGEADATTSAR